MCPILGIHPVEIRKCFDYDQGRVTIISITDIWGLTFQCFGKRDILQFLGLHLKHDRNSATPTVA